VPWTCILVILLQSENQQHALNIIYFPTIQHDTLIRAFFQFNNNFNSIIHVRKCWRLVTRIAYWRQIWLTVLKGFIYFLNNKLSPMTTVILEKLIVAYMKPVKKFPSFHVIGGFITAFKTSRRWAPDGVTCTHAAFPLISVHLVVC
jgi:hypothetical protein